MLRDPEIRAIWFSRGGYGVARLLEQDSVEDVSGTIPKLLIGYSDLTALFSAAVDRVGPICLYGPVVSELGDRLFAYHSASLRRMLGGREYDLRFRPATGSGTRAGAGAVDRRQPDGAQSSLWYPLSRPGVPRSDPVLLEEIGEQTYRIDGMLTQLRQSGLLKGLSGVLVGSVIVPPRRRFPPDRQLSDVLRELFQPLGIPVVLDLPVGHRPDKRTVPLGATTEIDTDARRVRFRA